MPGIVRREQFQTTYDTPRFEFDGLWSAKHSDESGRGREASAERLGVQEWIQDHLHYTAQLQSRSLGCAVKVGKSAGIFVAAQKVNSQFAGVGVGIGMPGGPSEGCLEEIKVLISYY